VEQNTSESTLQHEERVVSYIKAEKAKLDDTYVPLPSYLVQLVCTTSTCGLKMAYKWDIRAEGPRGICQKAKPTQWLLEMKKKLTWIVLSVDQVSKWPAKSILAHP